MVSLLIWLRTRAMAERPKLKLLHITKNAGTALEKVGLRVGLKWGRQWKQVEKQKGKLRAPHEKRLRSEWWHVPPSFFLEDPYEGCLVFAVLRCPYRRAISEFRCPWKGFLAPARQERKKEMRLKATKGDLNAWLQSRLPKLGPPFRNGHLIPQHLYIFKDGRPYVAQENRLRFDHLAEDLGQLAARCGLDLPEPAKVNESEMPRFGVEDLDQCSRTLIEEVFAKDFDLLGFPRLEEKRGRVKLTK